MALAAVEARERAPDEYRHGLVALVSLGPEAPYERVKALLALCGGRLVALELEGYLAVVPDLERASDFARLLHRETRRAGAARPRIGINLGSPGVAADLAFAETLRRRALPGETLISATSDNRLTSRVRAEGPNEPQGWRGWVVPAIGLTGFLVYFFGWFYAIYWKLSEIAITGHATCWPDWLCR